MADVSRLSPIPDYDRQNQMDTGVLVFDSARCSRCLTCVHICPARSILMDKTRPDWKTRVPFLDCVAPGVTLCVACGDCSAACPERAITIDRGFNAGGYFKRLSQTSQLTLPHRY